MHFFTHKFRKKQFVLVLLMFYLTSYSWAQNTAITDDDSYNAQSSAVLDVHSESKGMLVPRLTSVQMNGISSAVPGLLIFNTDSTRFYFYTGAEWMAVQGGQFLQTSADSVVYFSTDKYVGVGTSQPMSKLSVQASSTNSNVPLFDVKNQAGDVIFAVYESGVEINFNEDAMAKGAKGGFAVGGLSTGKAGTKEYLRITPDSVRIYFDDAAGKGAKGGFAVGGLSTGKAGANTYFTLSDTNARIDLKPTTAKGAKGGFAVGGLSTGKADAQDLLLITPDSARIYFDTTSTKRAKGGFAVGGLSTGKVKGPEFLRISPDSARIYVNKVSGKGAKGGFAVGGLSTGKGSGANFLDLTPENYFIGDSSGISITSGLYNSFFGYATGKVATEGSKNIFIGYNSGWKTTIGNSNTFVGTESGKSNVDGSANTFIGENSGKNIQHGSENTFIGTASGAGAQSGSYNVFMGVGAGMFHYDGNDNVYLGNRAGLGKSEWNLTNERNVFIGVDAGNQVKDAIDNVFIGHKAGQGFLGTGNGNITGDYNVIIGERAGRSIQSGSDNVIMGTQSGSNNKTGSSNVIIGNKAGMNATGNESVMIGNEAGYKTISPVRNVYIGNEAGHENVIGQYNTYIGNGAGRNGTDYYNTVLGALSASNNDFGGHNVIIGYTAGRDIISAKNVMVGQGAGYNNEGAIGGNVFIGYKAGSSLSSADYRLAISSPSGTTESFSDILIYGEFDNDYVQINGTLNVDGLYSFPTSAPSNNQVLVADGTGASSWETLPVASANNGLSISSNSVQLGSTSSSGSVLSHHSYVNLGAYNMIFNMTGVGDFEIRDNNATGFFLNNVGRMGLRTSTPMKDIHIVGSTTTGGLLVSPMGDQNGNAELILAEDDDYTYGMSIYYNGADNQLEVKGKSGLTYYGPNMIIERSGAVLFPQILGDLSSGSYLRINTATGQIGTISKSEENTTERKPLENSQWLYQLDPIQFYLKNDEAHLLNYGFDEASAAQVNPDLVIYDENKNPVMVDETKIVPVLVKELQNKDREINELKEQVNSLAKKLIEIEEKLNK